MITSPSLSACSCTTTPLTCVPLSRAEVDDLEAVIGPADLGVVARHLGVGERDRAVGEAADADRLVAELRCGRRRGAPARRSCPAPPPTIAASTREVADAGASGRHERDLDRALEVVALDSRPCSRTVSASSRDERVVEAGEALEVVVGDSADREVIRRRRCRARRACGPRPSRGTSAAADLDGLQARCGTPSEPAFDKPLEPCARTAGVPLAMLPMRTPRDGPCGWYAHLAHARVAELADAQDSGSCARKGVGVQVPPRARFFTRFGFAIAHQPTAAAPTMFGGTVAPPKLPKNGALEKLKMPPSRATSR